MEARDVPEARVVEIAAHRVRPIKRFQAPRVRPACARAQGSLCPTAR
jgi:hypothetical protein